MGLITFGSLPLFITHFGSDATTLQLAAILTSCPWMTKTIVGAISDRYPIFGYYKRVYIIGFLGLLVISLLALTQVDKNENAALVYLTIASFCLSSADILGEGAWTEAISFQKAGSDLSSYVWALSGIGTGCAAILVGFLGKKHILLLFGVSSIFPISIIAAFYLPGFWESIIPNDRALRTSSGMLENLVDNQKSTPKNAAIFINAGDWVLGVLLCLGSIFLIGLSIRQAQVSITKDYSEFVGATITTVALTLLILGTSICMLVLNYGFHTLQSIISCWMLVETCCITGQSAIDYFFLSPDSCIVGGPHFSYSFYITIPAIIGSITCLFTSAFFAKHGLAYTTRGVAQFALLLRICGSVVGEIGPAMIGPDSPDKEFKQKTLFFVGVAVLYTAGCMLLTLNLTTFVSNLVQKGRSTFEFSLLVRTKPRKKRRGKNTN